MVLAQLASEVNMLARKMDAFLATSKSVVQVTEAGAAAPRKGECVPVVVMPNRMVALFRSYIRGKLCKNPLSESKGHFKKKVRDFFYASSVSDGGSVALEFFKSIDPTTATAQLQLYAPSNGVS